MINTGLNDRKDNIVPAAGPVPSCGWTEVDDDGARWSGVTLPRVDDES
jgi:hypothetical protein